VRSDGLRAKQVVDRFQWITAATVFTNPIPALDLMATGAVQFQMISEIAGVYGVDLSTAHVKMIGSQMIQNAAKARDGRSCDVSDRGNVQGLDRRLRGRWRGAGCDDGLPHAHFRLTFAEYFAQGQPGATAECKPHWFASSISIAARTSYRIRQASCRSRVKRLRAAKRPNGTHPGWT